jgi:prepilin-type N-terminal cleavage/methylation domain-containing protein
VARRCGPKQPGRAGNRGFTLLEILVALGVASVAAFIAVSFFLTSYSYADLSRHHKVAASVAEGQLHRLMTNPGAFVWPDPASMEPGKPVEIRLRSVSEVLDPPFEVDQPEAKSVGDKRAGSREVSFYSEFTWTPYAIKRADEPYLEVCVVVRWVRAEEPQSLTLTSAVPQKQVEGLSS